MGKQTLHKKRLRQRALSAVLAIVLLIGLFPAGALTVSADAQTELAINGIAPYAQGCTLQTVEEPVFDGTLAAKASGRTQTWHGVAWNLPKSSFTDLREDELWAFSIHARTASGTMTLLYNLEFHYNNGSANRYLSVQSDITDSAWTSLSGAWTLGADYMGEAFDYLVIYPVSADGQLGDYYVDAPVLTQTALDDMTLCGAQPYGQGAELRRVNAPKAAGNDAMLVENRTAEWTGAAWNIPAANMQELFANNLWSLSLQARTLSGSMQLMYNLEFWYNDGSANKYLNISASVNNTEWTTVSGEWELGSDYLNVALDHVVIYPFTTGQQGSYYLDAPSLTRCAPDDMSLCTAQPYAQGGSISRSTAVAYTGTDSVRASGRLNPWEGVAWSIPATALEALGERNTWSFSAMARSADGAMDMLYNLEFHYNDGRANQYLSASAVLSANAWTQITATWTLGSDYLNEALDRVVVYPASGEGQLGDYYIDAVSLSRSKLDDMTLFGAEPYAQQCSVQRVTAPIYVGNDALLATNRTAAWSGVAWSIPASQLESLSGSDIWTLSMQLRAAAGSMSMAYNVEFWYNDGRSNQYLQATASINDTAWTQLSATWTLDETYVNAALDHIVLYPTSGDGQLGDYYVDAPSLSGQASDDMRLYGVQPHAQESTLRRVTDMSYTGGDALLVTDRTAAWSGAAWSIQAENFGTLADSMRWSFALQARAATGTMDLTYQLELWYSDGSSKTYSASAAISDSVWTQIAGSWEFGEAELNGLTRAVLYPVSGDGQLGDYYVDAPSMTVKTQDNMQLLGAQPYGLSCTAERVGDPVYEGVDALLATGRTAVWNGIAWDIPADTLPKCTDLNLWQLAMQVRAASGSMELTYNIEFWYNDGRENKYLHASASISDTEWTQLSAVWLLGEDYLNEALDHIVVYPTTADGQLGDYYVDAPVLTRKIADDMTLCGSEPYGQEGSISRVSDTVYAGNDALLAADRTAAWSGAAWSIPASQLGELLTNRLWSFSAQLRSVSGNMDMTYSVEFWYTDGRERNYLSAAASLNDTGWTKLSATWEVDASWLGSDLEKIVIYPTSGDGQLGNYLVDAPALTGAWIAQPDDMTLCGSEPYGQEGSISRVSDRVYAGNDALLAADRTAAWSGAAWSIPASQLGELLTNRLWSFSAQLRSVSGNMDMTYSVEFWYTDGRERNYLSAAASLNDTGWTKLSATWEVDASWLGSDLEKIVIYPTSGDGQLGNYLVDAPALTGAWVAQPDDMTLCGSEPYGQEGSVSRVSDTVYAGNDALLAADRTAAWSGAAWSIPASQLGELLTNRLWSFSAQLRSVSGNMDMTYSVEFWYTDGRERNYLSAAASLNDTGWTKLSATWEVDASWLGSDLEKIVIYPTSGDGQLGNYLVDAPALTGAWIAAVDNMEIAGNSYFVHSDGTLKRTSEQVYTGNDSLKVCERTKTYSGAGWDVKQLLESLGAGTWEFTVYGRAATGSMYLSYSIYLRYKDGSENWLFCADGYLNSTAWTKITGKAFSTTAMPMRFDNLETAYLYPATGEGQLGAYYLDAVSFRRTGNAVPVKSVAQGTNTMAYTEDYFPLDGGFESNLNLGQLGYAFNHGTVSLQSQTDEVYEGDKALLVTKRGEPYAGAGYDVTGYLKAQGWGNWFFSAYAKSAGEPMSLSYSIYLRFADGSEDWLSPGYSYYVTNEGWTRVNSDYAGGDARFSGSRKSYDFSTLELATLYPCTGEGELDAYYLDGVTLYKGADEYTAPVFTFDTFPMDGTFEEILQIGAPGCLFKHGEASSISRTTQDANSGSYCLLVSDRASTYSGPAWNVTDYLKQEGWGNWYFSAYAKSADGESGSLTYSVYLRYSDGQEKWLTNNNVSYYNSRSWMRIGVDTTGNPAQLISGDGTAVLDFSNLEYAVLYPSSETQEGAYYLDDVQFWREDAAVEEEEPDPEQHEIVLPDEKPLAPVWPWIAGGAVLLVLLLAGTALLVHAAGKKRRPRRTAENPGEKTDET